MAPKLFIVVNGKGAGLPQERLPAMDPRGAGCELLTEDYDVARFHTNFVRHTEIYIHTETHFSIFIIEPFNPLPDYFFYENTH